MKLRRLFRLLVALVSVAPLITTSLVAAQTTTQGTCGTNTSSKYDQQELIKLGIYFVNSGDNQCCISPGGGNLDVNAAPANNLDYAGRPIFTQAQLQTIQQNQPIYEQAAQQVGIPWQVLAVLHTIESGLSRSNPGNGQGIYQFFDKHGGPYPPGPIDDAEFLRQSNLAAQFFKDKASANYPGHQQIDITSSSDTVKDTFFSYNGRAQVYIQQAISLGFSSNQGYEGSPYVMDTADAKRDPAVNPSGWGQIKTDGGGISYPANAGYGAYVRFSVLNGSAGSCDISGTARDKIVGLAQQELSAWESGSLAPGSGYLKYTQGRHEDWCADFASWIYNQAGVPLTPNNSGDVPAVSEIKQIGISTSHYHDKTGYTPRPGDLVIRLSAGQGHVNIVTAVQSDTTMTVIGGNQGGGNGGFEASKVTQYTDTFNDPGITGYVTPN